VGAFPGVLPPVIGWTAARGSLDGGAFVLFAILFLWQIPHFLAIAWIYRDDYARGGLPMLPVLDPSGHVTGRQAVANSLALLLVSVVPSAAGMTGAVYLYGALALGLGFTGVAVYARSSARGRRGRCLRVDLYSLLSALLLLDASGSCARASRSDDREGFGYCSRVLSNAARAAAVQRSTS
jgi:protoheme IX farnesyltransferase